MNAPYTVMVDGVPIQCESAEAAIALAKLHSAGSTPTKSANQERASHNGGSRWTEQRIAEFYKHLEGKGNQRRLIDALMASEDSKTDEQLLQLLGLNSGMELAGVFAGLYKNAKKVGADPRELYLKKPLTIGERRGFEYTLHHGFRSMAGRRVK